MKNVPSCSLLCAKWPLAFQWSKDQFSPEFFQAVHSNVQVHSLGLDTQRQALRRITSRLLQVTSEWGWGGSQVRAQLRRCLYQCAVPQDLSSVGKAGYWQHGPSAVPDKAGDESKESCVHLGMPRGTTDKARRSRLVGLRSIQKTGT